MDTVTAKPRFVEAFPLHGVDVVLGCNNVTHLTDEEMFCVAPLPIDGLYHSDVASLDSQPSLEQRLQKLPKNFLPSGMSDDECFDSALPRCVHDISDVKDYTDYYNNEMVNLITEEEKTPVSSPEPLPNSEPSKE